MTYNYEALLEHHFQMLCQSLLLHEFPNLQCLPVAMPDGGRDGIAPNEDPAGAIIFQVKFARKPAEITDTLKWLSKTVDGELAKIRRLASLGAKKYILVTNVSGSSHLRKGSIDKLQEYLDEVLPITGQCLWRSDLDRRLDNSYDLKLRYPALLDGSDLIRLLWESSAKEDEARRKHALYAYFGHFYERESRLRFRQAELITTQLLDLFVDVPSGIALRRYSKRAEDELDAYRKVAVRVNRRTMQRGTAEHETLHGYGAYLVWHENGEVLYHIGGSGGPMALAGTADLLLDDEFATTLPRIVLEGAPGQGKSTLAQYLAQIQRARLLNKVEDLKKFPSAHLASPLMLPLKLELRDVATWLDGLDPWGSGTLDRHNKPTSLEGALAAHIERYSGGVSFNVSDLLAVMRWMRPLLILDALDEVADLDARRAVVDAIQDSLSRLDGQGLTPIVVITSRPTAISNAPSLPSEKFAHLTLAPIEAHLALDYAEKWGSARGLAPEDRADIRDTLRERMYEPHMEELAKNTMQLSILLSLILSRGSGLPDRRTELYDTYIDVFLNREAEKSEIVRGNRDLLKNIHGYLGYHLHAGAEWAPTSGGRIGAAELRGLLREYLIREGQPLELLDSLFIGVDRIFALVSRVEGTYEFEVQPLREYFAARFLNDTAPISLPGRERAGAKPDRFDGISSNSYWSNVTRFFAGCFSKGELADLADRLLNVLESPRLQYTVFPRYLAISLLRDWVFHQSPKSTRRVVDRVFDDLGVRWVCGIRGSGILARLTDSPLLTGAAADRLFEILWDRLSADEPNERTEGICSFLRENYSEANLARKWLSTSDKEAGWGDQRLVFGAWLGVLGGADVHAVLSSDSDDARLAICAKAGVQWEGMPEALLEQSVRALLDHADGLCRPDGTDGPLPAFASLLEPQIWIALSRGSRGRLRLVPGKIYDSLPKDASSPTIRSVCEVIGTIARLWEEGFDRRLAPWNELTGAIDSYFGASWTTVELSVISASIVAASERGAGARDLFSASTPLPERIRNARRRGRQRDWWLAHHQRISSSYEAKLWLLALNAWTTPDVALGLISEVDLQLRTLPSQDASLVVRAARLAGRYSRVRQERARFVPSPELLKTVDIRTLAIITMHLPDEYRSPIIRERLIDEMDDPVVATVCLELVFNDLRDEEFRNGKATEYLTKCFRAGASSRRVAFSDGLSQDRDWCVRILSDPWDLPDAAIAMANRYATRPVRKPKSVKRIAESEGWF